MARSQRANCWRMNFDGFIVVKCRFCPNSGRKIVFPLVSITLCFCHFRMNEIFPHHGVPCGPHGRTPLLLREQRLLFSGKASWGILRAGIWDA